ncbi:MAG: cache domain-containing protein, partial [Gammaproteobacteria bacterium]|nr:cache domain-containing protein [Gammaproteobacteria bacterium]
MNQAIFQFETSAAFGLYWPTWLAVTGIIVFCLLGLYAGLLFFADQKLVARFRFLLPPTLRGRIMLGIILAATLPATSLALVLTERATSERLDQTADLLKSQTNNFARMADYFLNQSLSSLKTLATEIDLSDQQQAQETIYRIHRSVPGFLSLLLIDTDGLVVAATEFGTRAISRLPIDTDYVLTPLTSGEIFLSGVHHHPGDATTVVAAFSVPVNDATGHTAGVLIGYSGLDNVERMKQPFLARNDIESILIDSQGKVLHVSELAGMIKGQHLNGESLLADPYPGDNKLFSFMQPVSKDGHMQRYLAAGHTLNGGWRIYLVRPLKSIETAMFGEYRVTLA